MSNVVPQAQSLGSLALYEILFRKVFATGQPVLRTDARAYCLSARYGIGAHFDAALELLINVGILTVDGGYLRPEGEFIHFVKENPIGLSISQRLVDRLAAVGEVESVFPADALSWGGADGEVNIHLSQIPLQKIAVVKLLRDLEAVFDSEESALILRAKNPFAKRLQAAVALALTRVRKVKILSPDQLENLQRVQAKQGADAEEFVVSFERKRLDGHAQIQLIRRISLTNTAAGYDIESFEELKSFLPDRFIEVKSHSGVERFFLSSGEMETAKELGNHYYLYVIDVEKCKGVGYDPLIIRNPAVELGAQDSEWSLTSTVYEVVRKKSNT